MSILEIIIAALAFAGGLAVYALTGGRIQFGRGKRAGKQEAEHDALSDAFEREEAGRDAVEAGRNSGLSPSERVRRNDKR